MHRVLLFHLALHILQQCNLLCCNPLLVVLLVSGLGDLCPKSLPYNMLSFSEVCPVV